MGHKIDTLNERVDKLQACMKPLMMELQNRSPNRAQTLIINQHESLGVDNCSTKTLEFLASIASVGAPDPRKLACKDLGEHFEFASNVADTEVTLTFARIDKQTFNSPIARVHGLKNAVGIHNLLGKAT